MAIDFNLQSNQMIEDNFIYKEWLRKIKDKDRQNEGYFLTSNGLGEYLPLIKNPAMNLYLFYSIHAKNGEGSSFYSVERLASELKVSVKTINNWNTTLQNAGLIIRKHAKKTSAITQLMPVSDFIMNVNNDNLAKIEQGLADDGFKIINQITIILVGKKNPFHIYKQFKRTFTVNNSTIERRIIVDLPVNNQDLNNKTYRMAGNHFMWIKSNQSVNVPHITITWSGSANDTSKMLDENIKSIIRQLETEEAIKDFKSKYHQLNE